MHAREDVDHPDRNFIGIAKDTSAHRAAALLVATHFPAAPYSVTLPATEAEFIKYTHNTLGYLMIVYANVLYDLATANGVEWQSVKDSILHNPWFPGKYLDPVHKDGRGAGGRCFVKDFAALVESYKNACGDDREGIVMLEAIVEKNNSLLKNSGKDIGIVNATYGEKGT